MNYHYKIIIQILKRTESKIYIFSWRNADNASAYNWLN